LRARLREVALRERLDVRLGLGFLLRRLGVTRLDLCDLRLASRYVGEIPGLLVARVVGERLLGAVEGHLGFMESIGLVLRRLALLRSQVRHAGVG
jgi:hypothetical protein